MNVTLTLEKGECEVIAFLLDAFAKEFEKTHGQKACSDCHTSVGEIRGIEKRIKDAIQAK